MKVTKSQLKQIIKEEVRHVVDEISVPKPQFVKDMDARQYELCKLKAAGHPAAQCPDANMLKQAEEEVKKTVQEELQKMLDETKAKRTAKGNITQDTREKYATVGKDKFPIFDKESAESAIKLRGHTSKTNQKKIINKAAKYAPEAAKKAREADKK